MDYKEYGKEWRNKHPDYQKNWRKEHPGYMKKYYKRNSMRKSGIQTETLLHADNKYNRWTIDDIEKLKMYVCHGLTHDEIAAKLHRTLYSVQTKVGLLKRKGEM